MKKSENIVIDEALATSLIPRRLVGAHKWSVGGLVIVGGAPGYVGAPALCARAAMRSGAGIVTVAVARGSIGPIASIVPEATFLPLPEGEPANAASRASGAIRERLEQSKAIVVGPGLSGDEHATELLAALFGFSSRQRGGSFGFGKQAAGHAASGDLSAIGGAKPAVVDADALNWLAGQTEWWTRVSPNTLILTPHAGEMARMVERPADEIAANPREIALQAAKTWKQVVLLKGTPSLLTDGEQVFAVEQTPLSLATAGTGDVLAGTIGAFVAQGLSLVDAGGLALYVGSRAATEVEKEFGTLGLVAGDLPDAIGRVLAAIERRKT